MVCFLGKLLEMLDAMKMGVENEDFVKDAKKLENMLRGERFIFCEVFVLAEVGEVGCYKKNFFCVVIFGNACCKKGFYDLSVWLFGEGIDDNNSFISWIFLEFKMEFRVRKILYKNFSILGF